jgi:membrane associated rhomboid family serine protease
LITGAFLLICWLLFIADEITELRIKQWGLKPRSLKGIVGIISMHFLHGDLKHIAQNSLSFLVLNSFLFYFYKNIAFKVFFRLLIFGGLFLWLWGRDGNHIGASLLIYGLASFTFFSGIFRSNEILLRVALVVAFYYGSIVWYVFPVDPSISWEGHLSGALAGIIFAWHYRGLGGPARAKYQWEIDEEMEALARESETEEDWLPSSDTGEGIEITYRYTSEDDSSEDDSYDDGALK